MVEREALPPIELANEMLQVALSPTEESNDTLSTEAFTNSYL